MFGRQTEIHRKTLFKANVLKKKNSKVQFIIETWPEEIVFAN